MDRETLDMFRSTMRRFVEERLIPAEDLVEESDCVPTEIVERMRELGLFGLSIPEAYGGIGCNMQEETAIIRELSRASSRSVR